MSDPRVTELMGSLRNPRWAIEEGRGPIALDAMVDGAHIVFFASANDQMDYGRDIHAKAVEGEYGSIGAYREEPSVGEREMKAMVAASAKSIDEAIDRRLKRKGA